MHSATTRGIAAATAVLVCGCGSSPPPRPSDQKTTATRTTTVAPPAPPSFDGERARAVRAVDELARASRDRDVERLCQPGAVFTAAVVAQMNDAQSCEQDLEASSILTRPPTLTVAKLTYAPDLAIAQVRVGRGATFPLDLVRSRGRWLVSFSDDDDPLTALAAD